MHCAEPSVGTSIIAVLVRYIHHEKKFTGDVKMGMLKSKKIFNFSPC